ncbi:hypothetical protein PSTG_09265 [Puccinia striiformis f. sp. tritici PST-78]|uniref:Nuclear transport factor 2 n=1 Tax=Puccinia striiformis f. sp. tritici PST-78 TaxID=1165861 RepID=A0A0L0VE03_9BASI|nr:hypothetical protein PSTG_09265 [Puccinia striiformis f. sp. tritici PST-78]
MEVAVNFSAVPVLRAFWLISGPVGRLELTETHQDPPPRPYRQPPSLSLYRLRKMSDPTQIASQFVQFYYEKFDTDRGQLAPLYRDHSMLTFEANPYLGTANIVKKLQELPFAKVTHQVHTLDAQPSNSATPSIIVLVTGALQIDGETNPLRFSQAFHLVSEDGSFFVLNDVFRLVYG